jgi:hypothetical protein
LTTALLLLLGRVHQVCTKEDSKSTWSKQIKRRRRARTETWRSGRFRRQSRSRPGDLLNGGSARRSSPTVTSVEEGLNIVRIEVELQKILQGQRIAKQNVTCVDLGLGGSTRARAGSGLQQSSYGVFT